MVALAVKVAWVWFYVSPHGHVVYLPLRSMWPGPGFITLAVEVAWVWIISALAVGVAWAWVLVLFLIIMDVGQIETTTPLLITFLY